MSHAASVLLAGFYLFFVGHLLASECRLDADIKGDTRFASMSENRLLVVGQKEWYFYEINKSGVNLIFTDSFTFGSVSGATILGDLVIIGKKSGEVVAFDIRLKKWRRILSLNMGEASALSGDGDRLVFMAGRRRVVQYDMVNRIYKTSEFDGGARAVAGALVGDSYYLATHDKRIWRVADGAVSLVARAGDFISFINGDLDVVVGENSIFKIAENGLKPHKNINGISAIKAVFSSGDGDLVVAWDGKILRCK